MGFVKLDLPCPKSSAVVHSADPEPRWTLDDLLTELNSLERQLGPPVPLKQADWDYSERKETGGSGNKPFVMCVSDDDIAGSESDDDRSVVTGKRFSCNDIYLSESEESDDEMHTQATESHLLYKRSMEEGILFELEREHQLKVKAEVRSKLAELEAYQKTEIERSVSAMAQVEKYTETRREMDKRLDKQYQRKIAEVLDKHLSAIQRDHEQRSQIEERRIRDDAALEEAKRKEKALHEEKVRQERAKAEAEAKMKAEKLAEAQKKALEDAAERAAKEAAEKEAARTREKAAAEVAQKGAMEQKWATGAETTSEVKAGNLISKDECTIVPKNVQLPGVKVLAAEAALKVEANRLKIYNEVAEKIHLLAQKDIDRCERRITKYVNQIAGIIENVRAKAQALINVIKDPACPPSISILLFSKKVVSLCGNPVGSFDRTAFACSHVILLVTSQIPVTMDFVLAEFHKACIYTVPKHLQSSNPALGTREYLKMIGYREEDGKIESSQSYLNRVRSYMKLYAALIQTEVEGIRNPHGLKEGWAWLAMFLNALPANEYTAAALESFLKMAGFALFRRYKSQFLKILDVISRSFLPALKKRDQNKGDIALGLEQYLDEKMYLKEPEGWRLQTTSLSREWK
ncbi:protein GLE1-like isoform X1 [Phoenix dactylifera]|uniref:mRNA export factor GLE1 n=2 Tax=Phoenix dactylifera TaxID=42345 RepID=A0A8B8ZUA3_PHODC|nr:protein GLE1-like isoform X1 [Phoenix dactylifera]